MHQHLQNLLRYFKGFKAIIRSLTDKRVAFAA